METGTIVLAAISLLTGPGGAALTYFLLGGRRRNAATVTLSGSETTERLTNTAIKLMDEMEEQLRAIKEEVRLANVARLASEQEARSAWEARFALERDCSELRGKYEVLIGRIDNFMTIARAESSWASEARARLIQLGWPDNLRKVPPIFTLVPHRSE
jgi:TolA-binding protein